jgi:hypothetical protein
MAWHHSTPCIVLDAVLSVLTGPNLPHVNVSRYLATAAQTVEVVDESGVAAAGPTFTTKVGGATWPGQAQCACLAGSNNPDNSECSMYVQCP